MNAKHIIPLDEIAAIAEGGIGAVHALISEGVRNKAPIEQGFTVEGLNGIPRDVVCELFQSGKLKTFGSGSILHSTQLDFLERHALTVGDLRFDPDFEKHHAAKRAAQKDTPSTLIVSPAQPRDLSPDKLLERFLLKENSGDGPEGSRGL